MAREISREVLERRMPPWPARSGLTAFLNDPTLSQLEVELLMSWAAGGAPLGPAPLPGSVSAPSVADEPDLVVALPGKHTVSGGSARFVLESGVTRDSWIERWALLPADRSLVAQADVTIQDGPSLGSWLPGERALALAPGHASRLPAGSQLVLDIQYRKPGGPADDQSAVALYFARTPAREVRHRALACGSTLLSEPIALVALRVRSERMGQNIEITARKPDGSLELLAWIPHARTDYEPTYRLRAPLRLPRGTRLDVAAAERGCSADLFYGKT